MARRSRAQKAPKGSVQFKNTKGRLQLVFSYPVKMKGVVNRKRFYISTGYEDTPVNRYRVGDIVKELQRDIDYGEVDLTLQRYQTEAVKAKAVRTSAEVLTAPNASASFAYDLAELWAQYTEFKRPQCSPSTIAKDFKKHRNHIARLPSGDLGNAVAIRNHLLENLTLDAAKRCLIQINACCDWAVRESLVTENPFSGMTRIRVPKSQQSDEEDINPFSKEERDLIIRVFMDNQYYRFYADFIRFLFFTGARPSEVIALQWKHMMSHAVKFEQAVVVSEEGLVCKEGLKTQAKRLFPINPQLMGILKSVREQAVSTDENALVFPSPRGKFIDQHNFANRAWQKILETCRVTYRKPYQTRHTFISLCVAANVNSTLIARWVGTSSRMIDKHYGASFFGDVDPPELV